MDAVAERRLDLGRSLQRAEDAERGDGGEGQVGVDVGGDAEEADDLQVQRLAAGAGRLELGAAEVAQAELQLCFSIERATASPWPASWLRIAVRIRSVRLA